MALFDLKNIGYRSRNEFDSYGDDNKAYNS